ncbi:radical SAM/SPASM domain-containing protein [Halobacteriovorax marinus]|uniref:radical SAM/SPASM domain-containing protein n=1 Tax=Halobacteriovorax marinus TaxID=97084 RepID=UPI003A8D9A5C
MLKRIYIEISNICNIQCSFCPVVERDKQIMSLPEFNKILSEAAPLAQEICLHLMGEPLAHPKFPEIMEITGEYQTQIQLTTNGLLLKRYQDLILSTNVVRQINFSLQSFKDNFPHKSLDEYLRPILDFVLLASEKRPELYINFRLWNQDSAYSDNSDIFDYVERFFGIEINRNVEVGAIKSKRIWNRLYLHFDSRFEWPSLDNEYQGKQGRCNGILSHIGIHADGSVVPCCLDKEAVINLGDCKKESLTSILSGKRASAMRDGFKNGVLVEDLCQKCSYINRFKK